MLAGVPTLVPSRSRERGMTITIRIRKGTLRSRFTATFRAVIRGPGTLRIRPFSPATSTTPRGRPIT